MVYWLRRQLEGFDPLKCIQGSQFLMYWHDVFVLFFGDVESLVSFLLMIACCMIMMSALFIFSDLVSRFVQFSCVHEEAWSRII